MAKNAKAGEATGEEKKKGGEKKVTRKSTYSDLRRTVNKERKVVALLHLQARKAHKGSKPDEQTLKYALDNRMMNAAEAAEYKAKFTEPRKTIKPMPWCNQQVA